MSNPEWTCYMCGDAIPGPPRGLSGLCGQCTPSKRRRSRIILALTAVVVIAVVMSGCGGQQQTQPPLYGQGDLPTSWVEYFGEDNGSRVNYRQMEMMSILDARLRRLEEFCRMPEVGK